MLLSRYSDINYVLELDYLEGLKLIEATAIEKNEEKIFLMWVMSHSDKSLNDFKESIGYSIDKKRNKEKLTKDEIFNKVKGIIDMTL